MKTCSLVPSLLVVLGFLLASGGCSKEAPPDSAFVAGDAGFDATAPDGFEASPSVGFEVFVTEASTGAPVPGAEVRILDSAALGAPISGIKPVAHDYEEAFDSRARRFRADAAGRVVLPPTARLLRGRTEALWGMRAVDHLEASPIELPLHPDPPLTVRIVDDHGTPRGGIPVVIEGGRGRFGFETVRSRGEDGIVSWPHAVARHRQQGETQLTVALYLPLSPPVRTTVEIDPLPAAPVELIVPPVGQLDVHVADEAGAPISTPTHLRVMVLPESEDALVPSVAYSVNLAAGEAMTRLPVELGRQLEVTATSLEFGPVTQRVTGPMRAGELVSTEVTLVPVRAVLVGRLIDEKGRPFAATRIETSWQTRVGRHTTSHAMGMSTDDEGRFRYVVRGDREFTTDVRTLTLSDARESKYGPRHEIDLGHDLPRGEIDLGDVVLARAPLLVSGWVFDDRGQALPHARVYVKSMDDSPSGTPLRRIDPRLNRDGDSAGCFEIRGEAGSGPLTVGASHPRSRGVCEVPFVPGTTFVRIILPSAGSLAGNVIVDGIDVPGKIQVFARRSRTNNGVPFPGKVSADGSFEIGGLDDDRWDVGFRLDRTGPVVLEILDVPSSRGETTCDLRLVDLELPVVPAREAIGRPR